MVDDEGDAGSRRGDDEEPNRRAFVALATVSSGALVCAAVVPAAVFVSAPLRTGQTGGKRFVVAKLRELEVGVPKRFAVVGDEVDAYTKAQGRRLGAVWLLRKGDREVRAMSVVCPHLGCGVELSAGGKGFACPCHESAFDLEGNRVSGPSPRAMDPLPVDVSAEGDVAITFQRFRIGVTAREEIG